MTGTIYPWDTPTLEVSQGFDEMWSYRFRHSLVLYDSPHGFAKREYAVVAGEKHIARVTFERHWEAV